VIGGSSDFAARRAGRLGDGFYPYVISPVDYAARLETLRATARQAGRDPAQIELSIWPGSYAFDRTFDVELVREYKDIGLDRVVVSAVEARTIDIEEQRDFIHRYQDEVLARL
jgi:alkanesulfonate monooxygenase SsuD/methylene tetrahydromethanopterin reductase-like flavin-dependent oxidoreductase (luciferase family)